MTHDSFSVSEDVLKEFEQQQHVTVQVLKSGDAGAALNKAILSKSNPLADVFFGIDNTFLSRALKAGIFDAYAAPALAGIPDRFKLDPANTLLPLDYGYVNINYDKDFLAKNQLTLPTKLEDLTKPAWKGKLVVENPATSSPGLAFMLATIAQFGISGSYTWLDYWKDLRANDVLVSDSWNDAYYTPTPPARRRRSFSARPSRSRKSRRPAICWLAAFSRSNLSAFSKVRSSARWPNA